MKEGTLQAWDRDLTTLGPDAGAVWMIQAGMDVRDEQSLMWCCGWNVMMTFGWHKE